MSRMLRGMLRDGVGLLAPAFPGPLRRAFPSEISWTAEDLRQVIRPKDGAVRCLIAPANYGQQGYHWARAAETIPGVSCTNMRFLIDGTVVRGKSDMTVRRNVAHRSWVWNRRQSDALSHFTHVLIEACLPVAPLAHGNDLREEVTALQDAGITVGLISHGSEVRLPSRHRAIEPRSPFWSDMGGMTANLERVAQRNLRIMDELGLPEFVSTPDLLQFRPQATWLPTVTSTDPWARLEPPKLGERKTVVLHVPSSRPGLKGADSIDAALQRLDGEGVIDYLRVNGVPHRQMPAVIEAADVVVNQVGIGQYGVLALEAMAAGRLVVAQVWESVRRLLADRAGMPLPIVEANSDDVYEVVKDIARRPQDFVSVAATGPRFVEAVHNQAAAADALRGFLSRA